MLKHRSAMRLLMMLAGGCLAVAAGSYRSVVASSPQQPLNALSPGLSHRAVIDKYCVTCHNQKLRTAELTLDTVGMEHVSADAAVWEKVIRKLRTRAMPPV